MKKSITEKRMNRIREVLARRQKDLTLIMDNIWDPHNVSAVLRSCDAFGVLGVHLFYNNSVFPELGAKSSGSAKKWVDCTEHQSAPEMIGSLREKGYQVIRTGFSETARPLSAWDMTGPTAIILSNEHRGTDEELAGLVPDELYIPMYGMVQSFNVSVAAAIILYEASSQRADKGLYDDPSLSAEELEQLRQDWAGR